jgi:hypothetical protein
LDQSAEKYAVPASGSEADSCSQRAGAATNTFLARGFRRHSSTRLPRLGFAPRGERCRGQARGRRPTSAMTASTSARLAHYPPADCINASLTMIAAPTVRPCHLRTAASLERRALGETEGSTQSVELIESDSKRAHAAIDSEQSTGRRPGRWAREVADGMGDFVGRDEWPQRLTLLKLGPGDVRVIGGIE